MRPAVSVIIPSFNNEKYIGECLDSVLHQSFKDVEIIICDDHSSDGTYDVILEYQRRHNNIRAIRNERNMGVTPSRHSAILKSTGRYITTLDHDDIYLSGEKLANELYLINTYIENHGKDICAFSDIIIINEQSEPIRSQWEPADIRQGNIFQGIITRACMIPRDFLFLRNDYFTIGGYDPALKLYEDWDLKIRLARKREFFYTGQTGTGYRRVNTGFSYAFSPSQHIQLMKEVFIKNLALIPENELSTCLLQFSGFLENRKISTTGSLKKKWKSQLKKRQAKKALSSLSELFRLRMTGTAVP